MLIYHPAFDNYHCVVRILKILNQIPIKEYNIDRIKIYDYYLLFPNELRKITLPTVWNSYKLIKTENRYNQVQNSGDIFRRISGFQNLALNALASYGLINNELLNKDTIIRTMMPIDIELMFNDVEIQYFDFINRYFNKIELKELKERTKIMDSRYELSKN